LKILPQFHPDIIQLDIAMPGMDGVEVIRQIRAWPEFSQVPILILSSFYRPDLAKEAWKAGANKCVSKMDCTPNLALELVEQLLSGENTGFAPKFGSIPLPKGALGEAPPTETQIASAADSAKLRMKLDLPPAKPAWRPPTPSDPPAPWPEEQSPMFAPRLKVDLDLPPSKGASPSRPSFAQEKEAVPPAAPAAAAAPAAPAKPAFFGKTAPAPFKSPTRPTFASSKLKSAQLERMSDSHEPEPALFPPAQSAPGAPVETPAAAGPDFRIEIRQDFLKRVPQIQAELRERVSALIKSKSTSEQFKLLKDLEGSISSLATLAGITGFSRVSHLSGALDALIKDLNKKPSQMTASVLRTIAHAMDCLNVLFRDLAQMPQDLPPSLLILVVDDEPISRRTISVALGKANLRCIAMADSTMALTVLKENPFDLIFLDAEMPGLNGFELCSELRKLPTNKATPVIFVTSLTKFEVRAQSSLSGGNDLIAKPFLMMELAVKALTYLLKPPLSVEARIQPAQEAG
jgi:CheY-like chemotaxis protein